MAACHRLVMRLGAFRASRQGNIALRWCCTCIAKRKPFMHARGCAAVLQLHDVRSEENCYARDCEYAAARQRQASAECTLFTTHRLLQCWHAPFVQWRLRLTTTITHETEVDRRPCAIASRIGRQGEREPLCSGDFALEYSGGQRQGQSGSCTCKAHLRPRACCSTSSATSGRHVLPISRWLCPACRAHRLH